MRCLPDVCDHLQGRAFGIHFRYSALRYLGNCVSIATRGPPAAAGAFLDSDGCRCKGLAILEPNEGAHAPLAFTHRCCGRGGRGGRSWRNPPRTLISRGTSPQPAPAAMARTASAVAASKAWPERARATSRARCRRSRPERSPARSCRSSRRATPTRRSSLPPDGLRHRKRPHEKARARRQRARNDGGF